MIRRDQRSIIYDVVMDNASLVRNYRQEFNGVIKRGSYDKLIEQLAVP
jgi:ABC-type transporter MlaC component